MKLVAVLSKPDCVGVTCGTNTSGLGVLPCSDTEASEMCQPGRQKENVWLQASSTWEQAQPLPCLAAYCLTRSSAAAAAGDSQADNY